MNIVKNAYSTNSFTGGTAIKPSDLFSFPNDNGFGFGGRPDVGPPLEPLDRVHNFRHRSIPTMMLFDWPEHLVSIGRRSTTTIAPQALMFMNSPQGRRIAESLYEQVVALESEDKLEQLFLRCYGRPPSEQEARISLQFLQKQTEAYSSEALNDTENRAWIDLCQTLLGSSEFIYID